jgi:hypothetical protein
MPIFSRDVLQATDMMGLVTDSMSKIFHLGRRYDGLTCTSTSEIVEDANDLEVWT